ncbi:39S ribosomal protein L22, mitochondrial [Coemansia sp. RSA 1813]|nr:39S ribosomal protein L22, mitochondrial [Coemansia sp. RSA 487]KAJ2565643.1 39S ribosomal protein L22, mitochondrial [Coemansia sp. RSA 1813]
MFNLSRTLDRLAVSRHVSAQMIASAGHCSVKPTVCRTLHNSSKALKEEEKIVGSDSKQASAFDIVEEEISKDRDHKRVDIGKGKGTVRIREYTYSTTNFHVSPRKLRLLANQITKQPVTEAIRQMEFSAKKAATKIKNSLVWARKNAVFQKQMNPDNMFIKLVRVGKGQNKGKRLDPKARGRHGIIRPPRAHLKYVLWEKQPEEKPVARNAVEQALLIGKRGKRDVKGFKMTNKVWMPLRERQSVINAKPFYNW